MADTKSVTSPEELRSAMETDDYEISEPGVGALYDVWSDTLEEHSNDTLLVVLPEWFSEKELDMRRPYLLASIEYDNSDKGAVLFSNTQIVDVSIVENDAYEFVPLDDVLTELDISDENDYIDESGLIWIPRAVMSLYERP